MTRLEEPSGGTDPTWRSEVLEQVLEHQVIARLSAAHLPDPACAAALASCLDRACRGDIDGTRRAVADAGGNVEELLTACDRRLRQEWAEDRRSFVEVTVALGTLSLFAASLPDGAVPWRGQVLLTTLPGEPDPLALALVDLRLRADGWAVQRQPGLEPDAFLELLRAEVFEAVGFTVSRPSLLPALAGRAALVRRLPAARRPALMVVENTALPGQFAGKHGLVHLACPCDAAGWLRRRAAVH